MKPAGGTRSQCNKLINCIVLFIMKKGQGFPVPVQNFGLQAPVWTVESTNVFS